MNVFYSPSTHGLKSIPCEFIEEMETIDDNPISCYFTDCGVYTICSEGTLYVSPRYQDGSFDTDVWDEVEYAELNQLTYIQDTLVEQAQKEGWYYTQAR